MEKIQARTIELKEEGGARAVCSGPNPWQEANATLLRWSEGAPTDGTYFKVDFKVMFANEDDYTGRFDLVHRSKEIPNLGKHILQHLKFIAGLWKPEYLSVDEYARVLKNYEEKKATYRHFIDSYDIPEGPEGSQTTAVKVLTDDDLRDKMPADERLALIRKVYEIAYKCTESFEEVDPAENNPPIGSELAYLFGAIASPYRESMEVCRGNSDLLQLLEENFPEDHPVWNYVDVVGETVPATEEERASP